MSTLAGREGAGLEGGGAALAKRDECGSWRPGRQLTVPGGR